jgi:hypothetical protein
MKRQVRKNSRLQARVDELQRELEHVETNIAQLDQAVNTPDREVAVRRLRRVTERQERRDDDLPRMSSRPEPAPAFSPAAPSPEGSVVPAAGDGLEGGGLPRLTPDRRFASYFVTGSLQSVRPLRTERRIQRNKAIIMVIFAIILLYGVLSALFANR